ncbi:hypothetical protein ACWDKQ_14805 [Saccharopolyspora sp. NPDC000995]
MLDTFYEEFGHGYDPRWHADVIGIEHAYLQNPRQALFVAARNGEVAATTAVRANGPSGLRHPQWNVDRYPSGATA